MNARAFAAACACLLTSACSARHLPPGTLPPEYETPTQTPWPAASASDGVATAPPTPGVVPANAPAAASPTAPSTTGAGASSEPTGRAELSPDASVR